MIKKITKKDMTAKPSIKENEKTVSVETAKTTSGSKKSFFTFILSLFVFVTQITTTIAKILNFLYSMLNFA